MHQPGVSSASSPSKVAKECARYIMCREGSKIPIKRSDIKEHLNKTQQIKNISELKEIIREADKLLVEVYGYRLMQLESNEVQYIVIRTNPYENFNISTYINQYDRKILIASLAHIFMSGTPIHEDDLWKFLLETKLVTDKDIEKKKMLKTTFTKQLYLKYTKIDKRDDGKFEWGERAEEEIPKLFLLEKVAEALEARPQDWTEQYRIAMQDDVVEDDEAQVELSDER